MEQSKKKKSLQEFWRPIARKSTERRPLNVKNSSRGIESASRPSYIAESHLEYAKDMWDTPRKVFQRKGFGSQMFLRRKLLMKISEAHIAFLAKCDEEVLVDEARLEALKTECGLNGL